MLSFASLLAVALAATGAVATTTSTAVEYTLPCLGLSVSASRIAIVQDALASGEYAVVPDLPFENCGSAVFYVNSASTSVSYTAYAVDANLGLGPAAFAESSGGASSFTAIYNVSPANGRRRLM
ncbi:hypothetical protein DFH08DRAFT_828075 [Mycena albidolilacea]|uniref:Uncharacterized protein n=1 Tax=Mycena albidolilacea TaxID=1033008 RepID=A0AAD7E6H6_9AGAR|nr:hypothetical protein DFH08DRAFT_828075 [Mycena albidolilacea]